MFENLRFPLIAAPMAGGPTTPELVAAVSAAGGFGFLAGGYLTADALDEKIATTAELTGGAFGVNLFLPGARSAADLTAHRERLLAEAIRYGVELGEPRWDDDAYPAKLAVVIERRVPVVSFTFGAPAAEEVRRLHDVGSQVVVTVTNPDEAVLAASSGADALCVQGFEAGGHRSLFADDPGSPAGGEQYGLLALLRLVAAKVTLPLIAAGGLVHGADIAAVLAAGAVAAQLGTVFLQADEAGTPLAQRHALAAGDRRTAFTRAFSGRPARGLVNRVLSDLSADAPAAYPQLHHLSKPVRAASAKAGDPEAMSLWAGQTYPLAPAGPAASIVDRLRAEAREALSRVERLR
ncbi:NAD(P)H-dependent flavin oxidoreductase [Amycolatopsis sp. H20-H5]|uniref:NAD(P)H-dependent flavin oxidoreductase n=1 Tax=Amycolatopsis sp. H20-H5 TaxID=3046309 RepID=UPI002DB987F1|nr:nitronate monooxygenase [Amycolatopsis sp. H20-H5]MEC3977263.1 nitronate monooxygenase [Amycolatopsis sp. H20-H5]